MLDSIARATNASRAASEGNYKLAQQIMLNH